ncbi:hypothetical protein [Candidatus Carsonella ruddii]|uniref:Cytochrome O ubiquinol oxidase subunit IV n=1 Tax=Carsonella ruddii TaxID=114186 RepID=A0AAE7G595_CARRU|nr:hypothetical protein [Candidatus Carsonella ruddii]AGS06683.1 hypothetical protein CRDC_00995 [Candidatus Carsonella ruddii DC]ALA96910.1 hypothetical protein AMC76_01050 [Candidatus Carsonella ruddii]QLK14156.1 hypothetical protein FK493_01060 [Candidatus Carsonella ruddii]
MSCFNYLYKEIILLKEKEIFFYLLFLTIHFFSCRKEFKYTNLFLQIITQIFYLLKIKSFKNKTQIVIFFFIFFTILILYFGINWIMINFKK